MISSRLLLILLLTLATEAPLASAQAPARLVPVKRKQADMLYLLGLAVQPAKAPKEPTFIIGVLGNDGFAEINAAGIAVNHLDDVAREHNAKRVQSNRRKIVIQRFKKAQDYKRCHLLFVSKAELKAALLIANREKQISPVLLVSYAPGLAAAGIPLNFYDEPGAAKGLVHVRLELNLKAATSFGFAKISPRLLTMLKNGLGRVIP